MGRPQYRNDEQDYQIRQGKQMDCLRIVNGTQEKNGFLLAEPLSAAYQREAASIYPVTWIRTDHDGHFCGCWKRKPYGRATLGTIRKRTGREMDGSESGWDKGKHMKRKFGLQMKFALLFFGVMTLITVSVLYFTGRMNEMIIDEKYHNYAVSIARLAASMVTAGGNVYL